MKISIVFIFFAFSYSSSPSFSISSSSSSRLSHLTPKLYMCMQLISKPSDCSANQHQFYLFGAMDMWAMTGEKDIYLKLSWQHFAFSFKHLLGFYGCGTCLMKIQYLSLQLSRWWMNVLFGNGLWLIFPRRSWEQHVVVPSSFRQQGQLRTKSLIQKVLRMKKNKRGKKERKNKEKRKRERERERVT